MDESDAPVQRLGRGMKRNGNAVYLDHARVRLQHAAQNIHQRGFARAVFSQQGADFPRLQGKIHLAEHFVCAEGFYDPPHGKVHGFTSSR